MLRHIHFLGVIAILCISLVGCGSGGSGSLATESGDMTPEEYQALIDGQAADMNAMPDDASQTTSAKPKS